jgi:hypothetical protein
VANTNIEVFDLKNIQTYNNTFGEWKNNFMQA